jgi:hypothetical protein
MNATSTGPLQFALTAYLICAIVSMVVAGIISLIFKIIKLQKGRAAAKIAAAASFGK